MTTHTRNHFQGKRIFITGGNGFIGAQLVKRLLNEQAEVAILTRKTSSLWRIHDVIKDIELCTADISDSDEVQHHIVQCKPDYIFHLAAYGVNSAHRSIYEAVQANVIGIINVVNAARIVGSEKIINVGSSSEYGDKEGIIHEDMSLFPTDIYGSTKAAATTIAHQIAFQHDLNIVTLRPFGIFGEGEEPHKLFSHILITALQNHDVDLTACEQYRDYCYIGNIIDGLLLSARNQSVKNEVYNIGSGEVRQLKYYVELIFKHLNTDRKPNFGAIAYREGERWRPQPDINKIKTQLGWEPKISLEEGMIRTVDWFRRNKEKYVKR